MSTTMMLTNSGEPKRNTLHVASGRLCREATLLAALRRIGASHLLLESLVASWRPEAPLHDGRWLHRVRFHRPVLITELDNRALPANSQHRLATARDLSLGGFSFVHIHPQPSRFIAVTFACGGNSFESLVVRLNWCRFSHDSRYCSGGPFIGAIRMSAVPDVDEWPSLKRQ